jgi:hypothetical protein
MANYSNYVGYVPDKLRIQVSGTVTGEGIVPSKEGFPVQFFVGLAQGLVDTNSGVQNPGLSLLTNENIFNIESGVNSITFQNIVSANGGLAITGVSGGVTISSCSFPKFEYSLGDISGISSRLTEVNLPSLKATEGVVFISGDPSISVDTSGIKRAKGYSLLYHTSGLVSNLDKTFTSYIGSIPINTGIITSIGIKGVSGVPVSNLGATGTWETDSTSFITTGLLTTQNITASSTFTGDPFPSLRTGSFNYVNPINVTNVAVALNHTGTSSTGSPVAFGYVLHSGTTEVTYPPARNAYIITTLNSSGNTSSGTPLNLTATGSGNLLGFCVINRSPVVSTNNHYRQINLVISGYTSISGIRTFDATDARTSLPIYDALATTGTRTIGSGGFFIESNCSSGFYISGHSLSGFISAFYSGGYAAYFKANNSVSALVSGTGIVYTSTGSGGIRFGVSSSGGSSGLYISHVGTGVSTYNFLNVTGIQGTTTLIEAISGGRITINAPETRDFPAATLIATGGTSSTFIVNTPKLTDGLFNLIVSGGGPGLNRATGTLIAQAPTGGNINEIVITGEMRGGAGGPIMNILFTENPSITGSGGAFIDTIFTTGSNLFNISGGSSLASLTLDINLARGNTSTFVCITTGTTPETSYRDITITGGLSGYFANIFITGFNPRGNNVNHIIRTTSGTANINTTFTGGTSESGNLRALIISGGHGTVYSGNYGNLYALTGTVAATGLTVLASGSGSPTSHSATLTATGLSVFSGGVNFSGLFGAQVTYVGGQILNLQQSLRATATGSGKVTFAFTGGTQYTGSYIAGDVFITSSGNNSSVSGDLGGVETCSGAISIFTSGATSTGFLQSSGLTTIQASLNLSGTAQTTTVVSGFFPGLTTVGGNVNVSSPGTYGLSASGLQIISGSLNVSGGSAVDPGFTGVLPALTTIGENYIARHAKAYSLLMTGLQVVSGAVNITGGGTPAAVAPGLSGLNALTGIATASNNTTGLFVSGSGISGNISLTGLQVIGNSGIGYNFLFNKINATGIRELNLPVLTGWYGSINCDMPSGTAFDLSSVQFLGSNANGATINSIAQALFFRLGTGITGTITLTGLQSLYVRATTTGTLTGTTIPTGFIFIASGATEVSIPNIVTGFVRIASGTPATRTGWIQGANITGLSFGSSGITKELTMHFTASGCALNQASVDDVLRTFASLDGTNGTTVYSGLTIRLNGLCSAPSVTGSGFRTTLTGAGRLNTVLVN